MRNANIIDIYNLQSMVDRRAKEKNLSVSFEHDAETAYTTENKIVLPTPRLPMTIEELDLIYGYMIHETGHHTRSRAFEILNNSGLVQSHPIITLFNVIEDGAMEREVSNKYVGDRKALGKGMLAHVKAQINRIKSAGPDLFKHEDQAKCAAIYLAGMQSRLDWDTYTPEAMVLFEDIPPQEAIDLWKELDSEGWVDKMSAELSPDASWDLACDLYKRLYPKENPEKIDKIKEQGHKKAEEGEKESGEGMQGVSQGQGKEEGKDKPTEVETVHYSWEQWVNSKHNNEGGIAAVINWDGRKFDDKAMPLHSKDIEVVQCKRRPKRSIPSNSISGAANIANAIRIFIQANARKRVVPEQYKGKLDRRAVTRLAFPPIDNGEWNKKVFYELKHKKYKNTCIGILTDWSGSMNGEKKIVAADATARLSYVFDTQLHVPTFITAFTSGYCNNIIGIIKDFNEKSSIADIHAKFDHFSDYTSGNADGDALLWMHERMKKRKEERKIIIVLSDGAPTDGHAMSNPDSLLKKVAETIEQEPDTTLIAIGIISDQVKRYYKNYKIINDINELDKNLLLVLKETYTHD